MSNNESASGGIGFFGLLTILFVGLKLGKVITWSWVWVLSPLWIPFSIILGAVSIIGILSIIIGIFN